jgi:hypothetical protein
MSHLQMNLNWFKSNIKRYFEIDVDPITIRKNVTCGLPETGHSSDIFYYLRVGNYEYNLPRIWRGRFHRFVNNLNGFNERWCGYCEGDSRLHKWNSYADGRAPFFIARVEFHYHNEVENDVYSPLVALGNDEPGYGFPVWRRRLGTPNPIDESFLTPTAVNHITQDSPRLLAEITEYQKHYNQYYKNIESLPHIIDSIVRSKFIEVGVYPTSSNNFQNIGYYHFGDVAHVLEQVWDNYLHFIDNLDSYKSKNRIATGSYSERNNILYLDSLVIGNGEESLRERMQKVMSGLPHNRRILSALSNLLESRRDLDRRVDLIQSLSSPFLTQIRRSNYRTQCPCCPTQNSAIWNFG